MDLSTIMELQGVDSTPSPPPFSPPRRRLIPDFESTSALSGACIALEKPLSDVDSELDDCFDLLGRALNDGLFDNTHIAFLINNAEQPITGPFSAAQHQSFHDWTARNVEIRVASDLVGLTFHLNDQAIELDRATTITHGDIITVGHDGQSASRRVHFYLGEDQSEVSIIRHVGFGGFSQVYAGQIAPDEPLVAVKVTSAQRHGFSGVARREINMLRRMRQSPHANIAGYINSFDYRGSDDRVSHHVLVTEFVTGCSFADLETNYPGQLTFEIKRHIFRGICEGLKAIHAARIIHGDIKPQNIMVTPEWIPKIVDFGNSGNFDEARVTCVTLSYLAPELIEKRITDPIHDMVMTDLSDCYSLGVMIYHFFTGDFPYDHVECGTQDHFRIHSRRVPHGRERYHPALLCLEHLLSPIQRRVQIQKFLSHHWSSIRPPPRTRAYVRKENAILVQAAPPRLCTIDTPRMTRAMSKKNRLKAAEAVLMTMSRTVKAKRVGGSKRSRKHMHENRTPA